MQIQIRINEEGALRNQRFAFTDRFTLVTELLQNARRAGAFHIVVDHLAKEQVLRAVICGYELAGRMPKALGIDNLRKAGIANHGIGPLFGTAAAAASIMAHSEAQIADVLTYCAQQASGSWQWLLDVEHIEKSFVFAAMNHCGIS